MDNTSKYDIIVEQFYKNKHKRGSCIDTKVLNIPIHPIDKCGSCYMCEDDIRNNDHNENTPCDNCQYMYNDEICSNLETNHSKINVLDYMPGSYGNWDSSDLFKVKWNINDKQIYGIIHFGIYYDPNAWDQYVSNPGDWYLQHNIVSIYEDKNDELFEKLKIAISEDNLFETIKSLMD
ncbi:MAG: hypothetical protein Terrestrivirus1_190 [Terrestrivirus sp.]|uniref:Uncharacterized protein n=1 Tax=Terrestrivirus sp. TaxID=2487775 RepID=A0A3G4ZKF4_9VIRU|nr:MAG: hypothetical protein Terrestrivirus1_190 [Terrestrivirus sp.]